MYHPDKAHYIAVTAIIKNKGGKYLIAKRASWEKDFPNKWTAPGGKVTKNDYINRPHDGVNQWYNVLEDVVRREVKEEVGLEIVDLGYLASIVFMRSDGIPCLVVSLYATAANENVVLSSDLSEYAWVNLEEAKNYDFIEGIYDEIRLLDDFIKTGKRDTWRKT